MARGGQEHRNAGEDTVALGVVYREKKGRKKRVAAAGRGEGWCGGN
jgi:hypothetical protein